MASNPPQEPSEFPDFADRLDLHPADRARMQLWLDTLREGLSVHLEFKAYEYGGRNQLSVEIKFAGHTVCESSCTVEPAKSEGYY